MGGVHGAFEAVVQPLHDCEGYRQASDEHQGQAEQFVLEGEDPEYMADRPYDEIGPYQPVKPQFLAPSELEIRENQQGEQDDRPNGVGVSCGGDEGGVSREDVGHGGSRSGEDDVKVCECNEDGGEDEGPALLDVVYVNLSHGTLWCDRNGVSQRCVKALSTVDA